MTAKIILNPYSARWRAEKRFPEVETALREAGVNFDVARSEGRSHCVALTEKAVRDGFSPIIAAGGDGTIGEVVNGLVNAAAEGVPLTTLGIIPLGTANDLLCNLKLPTDLKEIARIIAAGKTRRMDLCSVNGHYFVNNTALGMEPFVTVIQEKVKCLKGIPRYLYASVAAIFRGRSWHAKIKWDDGEYSGPISLISIGNGARTGGLFYVTPHADLFDGELTCLVAYARTRLEMLRFLPLMMQEGGEKLLKKENVFEINTKHLLVKLVESTPSHADGEIFDRELYQAEYWVYPGRLPILMP
jgi:diacylglycerol kinase (ATP)